MTKVVCRELHPRIGELEANHAAIVQAIAGATGAGADVVVLPELATTGYCFDDADELRPVALTLDDPRIAEWSRAISGGAVAVVGFAEHSQDGRLYNSAAMVSRDGVLAIHRKAHLWDRERLLFDTGSDRPPVVSTAHGRIGMMVCYDLEFPEYTRLAALDGAQLLAVPTNWPLVDRPTNERPPEVLIGQATARVNRMAIACCDRGGSERGQSWTQGTTIIDTDGWVAAGVGGDCEADLDLDAARSKRLTENADLFADRRTDIYRLESN